ncbi:MAG: hypothetical protein ASARMPRED_006537 [Alectoria sarmentosa]|nr:MAG: hypothetical protein ASARMPRED_006537 [Alectoria sarmentosa]
MLISPFFGNGRSIHLLASNANRGLGFVAHTAASRPMAENPLMQDFVDNVCGSRLPSARFIVQDASERARKQSERMFGRGAEITLESFGSHERTVEEWRKLLRAADPQFELVNINRAPNKPNTILEVAWTGQDLGE